MTREELIDYVDFLLSQYEISYEAYSGLMDGIYLLEREPCEDTISRQAVIELCEGWWLGHTKEDDFATAVRALPSVNPQKGHWIIDNEEKLGNFISKCSVCGHIYHGIQIYRQKYCANCGAKMIDPQESEEEE